MPKRSKGRSSSCRRRRISDRSRTRTCDLRFGKWRLTWPRAVCAKRRCARSQRSPNLWTSLDDVSLRMALASASSSAMCFRISSAWSW